MIIAAANYTWYAARAGGMLAFVLLTSSVVAGLMLSSRDRLKHWPRFALEDVHRFLGLLAGSFIALHGGALLLDSYLPFTLGSLLIPGTAPYRPLSVALGIVGAELLVALAIANRYRKQLGHTFWKRTHYLNFAVWALALAHGLAAGTDTSTPWAAAIYVVSASLVVGLTVRRVLRAAAVERWAVRFWPGTAAVVAAELIIILAFGPLRHHGA
jgi:methionine sulfoxide reductase heme-binding subunit